MSRTATPSVFTAILFHLNHPHTGIRFKLLRGAHPFNPLVDILHPSLWTGMRMGIKTSLLATAMEPFPSI